jgi:transposase
MQTPLLVRPLSDAERQALEAGLRSPAAFTLRRCQILLASARGEHTPQIARGLGCHDQTVREAIHAFHATGLAALAPRPSRPRRTHPAFGEADAWRLRDLLHRSPREFGHPTSLWTLELAAAECHRQGITAARVSGETVRATLARLGLSWQRAKTWITSPDPEYVKKNGGATA